MIEEIYSLHGSQEVERQVRVTGAKIYLSETGLQ
jgi:hypothetical protein